MQSGLFVIIGIPLLIGDISVDGINVVAELLKVSDPQMLINAFQLSRQTLLLAIPLGRYLKRVQRPFERSS